MAKDKTGECMCTVYSVGMYCTFKYIDGLDEKKTNKEKEGYRPWRKYRQSRIRTTNSILGTENCLYTSILIIE